MRTRRHVVALGLWGVLLAAVPATAQPVTVSSADPNIGAQERVGLQVRVKGKGFASGARAEFLLDDNSTGGITVEETTLVSSRVVVAKINMAAGASLNYFDIRVINTSGRTGRGSDLFQVVAKGGPASCANEPLDPTRFELVGTLNYLTSATTAAFGPGFGVSASLAAASLTLPDLSVKPVLVAAVGTSRTTGRLEVFVLDAGTGALLDGQRLCPSCDIQSHVTVSIPAYAGEQAGSRFLVDGDVNADGIPDFAVADPVTGCAAVFVGSLSAGRLTYSAILVPRPSTVNFAHDIALGDLDGNPGDELAVGKPAGGTGKNASGAAVYLYRFSGGSLTLYQTVIPASSAGLKSDDWYASDVAIGDVTGDGRQDLIVGVPNREVGGLADAGAIFVHPGSGAAPPYAVAASPLQLFPAVPVSKDYFGFRVEAANADSTGALDVVGLGSGNSGRDGEVVQGPVLGGQQSNPLFTFEPRPGVDSGWANNSPRFADLNGDGLQDIVMGLPNATTSTSQACPSPGAVYVFLGKVGGGWDRLTVQGPPDEDNSTFGYGVGAADGHPFFVVGNNQFNLIPGAEPVGQAFIYRVKNPSP